MNPDKAVQRAAGQAYWRGLSALKRQLLSEQIGARLLATAEYQAAATVAMFVGREAELLTWPWICAALRQGKRVALPRVNPQNHTMDFFEVSDAADLQAGWRGLLEPKAHAAPIAVQSLTWMLLPAVAVAVDGTRLGKGGGFYDRFLAGRDGLWCVGAVPERLLCGALPRASWDMPVDQVVTEQRVWRTVQRD